MQGAPISFWGKLQKDGEDRVVAWHPLADHCADVAACCEALLLQPVWRRRLASLAGLEELDKIQCARLCVLAALHDIGKFNQGFQNKSIPNPAFKAGHVAEVICLFSERGYAAGEALQSAILADQLARWDAEDGATACSLLLAAISHHGQPIAIKDIHEPRLWNPDHGRDPFAGIAALTTAAMRWFPEACQPGSPLPASTTFQHAFSGLVMLADWLGSDAHEDFFPYSEAVDTDRISFARERARRAVARMGLDPSAPRTSLGPQPPDFTSVSGYPPRPLQQAMLELATPAGPGLTILEAETGAGKTEAALVRFLRLFHAGQVDGLYFALPTRTAATQIHHRLVEAIGLAFPDPTTRPPVLLAVPGYLLVDETQGLRLPHFEVLWNDQDQERFRFRGWAAEHPKRYLAGAIVVGTVDQVLLSTLQVSHSHLRATALLRHLLVVDEVHASDAHMTRLLEEVLRFHLAAGGHALLMSATLGTAARHRYLATLPSSPSTQARHGLSLKEALVVPYPSVHHAAGASPGEPFPILPRPEDRPVRLGIKPWMEDPEAIAELAIREAASGARVLVLRNTVRGCLEVQGAVERQARVQGQSHLLFRCQGVIAPHHARFGREDRAALDQALSGAVGKHGASSGVVVVATQTIQQSLDVDFDLLLTDLCPADVLLQRLGRLHRHRERDPHRPARCRIAICQVLVPVDRDPAPMIRRDGQVSGSHGIGTVYDDLLVLEATWRLLEEKPERMLPAENRELVERATHPEVLHALARSLGPAGELHWGWLTGKGIAHRRLASLNLVDRQEAFGEAHFIDHDQTRKISSRLGAQDRMIRFRTPLPGPFGQEISSLTIPEHLARDLPSGVEDLPAELLSDLPGFRIPPSVYLYDRLGLRLADPGPTKEATDA